MNRVRLTRRQVLRGAAGFTLALPFLPSLAGKADAADPTRPRRFIALATSHGGVRGSNMYPSDATLTNSMAYVGRDIRSGALAASVAGGRAVVSPVLSADSSKLTPALLAKMNLVRGLDITFSIAHHTGGHLGNYARNDENNTDSQYIAQFPRPTIDQVLAWSPSFYPDLASILQRSLVIGPYDPFGPQDMMSFGWSNPQQKSGDIEHVPYETSSKALFDKIFVPPDPTESKRPAIVDRVLADYKRLRQDTRLSKLDQQRLDDHLSRLEELERRLNAEVSCGSVMVPTGDSRDELDAPSFTLDPDAHKRYWQLFNDVVVAAFACDTSRIATLHVRNQFHDYAGDWHESIAHQSHADTFAQQVMIDHHQRIFEHVFVDLATKLDAVPDGEGSTLLDAAFMQWTHESGPYTHDAVSMPIVTAGSAGGFLKTGSYLDYRDLTNVAHNMEYGGTEITHSGLSYNQWLGSVLQAMGLPPSEYEQDGVGGYGYHYVKDYIHNDYQDISFSKMSEVLPFLKA